MDEPETNEVALADRGAPGLIAVAPAPIGARSTAVGFAQVDTAPCPTCGGMDAGGATASYVYALGQIEARFPRPAVEKEMAQVMGRAETARLTDGQAFYQVLSQRENRYLARQMCWVFTVQGTRDLPAAPARSGGLGSLGWRDRAKRQRGDQRGHRRSWPRCAAGLLQWPHGPDRRLRSDLHVLA